MTASFPAWQGYQVVRQLRVFRDSAGEIEKEVVLIALPGGLHAVSRRIRDNAKRWLTPEQQGVKIQREIAAAAPSLVPQVFEERSVSGWWISTVEFIQGRDVHAHVIQEGYNLRVAVLMACKLCAAVEVFEKLGYIHNDLKPQHFIVRPDSSVAIIDWGSSSRRSEPARAVPRTPLYTPPEGPGPCADIWALAVTLFHVLANDPPYPELADGKVLFGRPVAFPGGWPAPLAGVFKRALALNPSDRFPDTGALRHSLQATIHLEERPTRPMGAQMAFVAPLLSRRGFLLPVAAALTAGAFGMGAMAARVGKPTHAKRPAPAAARKGPPNGGAKTKKGSSRKKSSVSAVKKSGG